MTELIARQLIAAYKQGQDRAKVGTVEYWTRIETVGQYRTVKGKREKVIGLDRRPVVDEYYEIRRKLPGGIWEICFTERKAK